MTPDEEEQFSEALRMGYVSDIERIINRIVDNRLRQLVRTGKDEGVFSRLLEEMITAVEDS